jgi:predicted nuclease of predicted toxin-antitoxin system
VPKLRFYLDESLNVAVANALKRRGIEAVSAKESGNLGLADSEQLAYAIENNYVIVTHDADFLAIALDLNHKGIVYTHLQKYRLGDLIRRLQLLWDIAEPEDMTNRVEYL